MMNGRKENSEVAAMISDQIEAIERKLFKQQIAEWQGMNKIAERFFLRGVSINDIKRTWLNYLDRTGGERKSRRSDENSA